MPFDEISEKQWKFTKFLAVVLLIVCPIIYLVVTQFVQTEGDPGGQVYLMFYILLIISILEPAFSPLIERFQLSQYRKGNTRGMIAPQLYTSVSMIKFAFVEAIYIYGLVIYFLTGDVNLTLYFYPIGMIWTIVVWPRRRKFEEFLEKAQLP